MPEAELTIESLFREAGADDAPEFVRHFEHAPGTRVHFGIGAVALTGALTRGVGGRRALLVTDPGIEEAGHLEPVLASLEAAGAEVVVFDQVIQNPTTETVEACVVVARAAGIDCLIGLGGGSSMDAAKGCNFLLTNGGKMEDYRGIGKATQPMLPLLVIPTTAGTGSECQSFALISDPKSHLKMACGDRKAAARHAILDPSLTLTMPTGVTAVTGIDALAHTIESAVCTKRNDVSMAYSTAGFRLLFRAFPHVVGDPADIRFRSMMQVGAALAGVAIENAMLGAAHAAANPLTAHFDVIHGIAVGVMLPHVIALNAHDRSTRALYDSFVPGGSLGSVLADYLSVAGLPRSLRECGVSAEAIPQLAREAAAQWTAGFNPVPVDETSFRRLYENAWA